LNENPSVEVLKKYIDPRLVDEVYVNKRGIKSLWEPQYKAIEAGIFEGKSLIVMSPPASGKTLIGEFAAVQKAFKGEKSLFLVPYKALADEKFRVFNEDYGLWFKTAIFTRDHSTPLEVMAECSLIVATYEKIELLIRQKIDWLKEVKLVIVDEIELLDHERRGPTLEILLTRLIKDYDPQIIGLSATLNPESAEEICKWLNSELVSSDFRPTELIEGLYSTISEEIIYKNGEKIKIDLPPSLKIFNKKQMLGGFQKSFIKEHAALSIIKEYLEQKKQILVFAETRSQAEDFITNLVAREFDCSTSSSVELAMQLSEKIGFTTSTLRKLQKVMKRGFAFHHAGLPYEARSIIEAGYRSRALRVVCSTTTLAAGVNLPADVVIILDHERKSIPRAGPLKVMEYKNMAGRAGRPEFSDKGYSIIIATHKVEESQLWANYIDKGPEKIFSKLCLKTNKYDPLPEIVLSLIATDESISTKRDLISFISKTFYGLQNQSLEGVGERIESIINNLLIPLNLVEEISGKYKATKLGIAFAKAGLSPNSVNIVMKGFETIESKGFSELRMLGTLTRTQDFLDTTYIIPYPSEINSLLQAYNQNIDEFPFQPLEEEDFAAIKASLILREWINETDENKIIENFMGVYSGDLERIKEVSLWILDSLIYIATEIGKSNQIINKMKELGIRINNGIKTELIPLFQGGIKSINRKEARNLFEGGYRTPQDIIKDTPSKLSEKGKIKKARARQLLYEITEKIQLPSHEKVRIRQIVTADKNYGNTAANLVASLYDAHGDKFTHFVEESLKVLLKPDYKVLRLEIERGDPDIIVKKDEKCIMTIECYAPKSRETPSISKILEANKGRKFNPEILAFCTNAVRIPQKEIIDNIISNNIRYLHISGLVELLLLSWNNEIGPDDVVNILRKKPGIIDRSFLFQYFGR